MNTPRQVVSLLLLLLLHVPAHAQTPCVPPAVSITPKGETIFSAQQEQYLGDVIAEQLRLGLIVYPQTELQQPLDRIATRLLKYLPENQYQFQFSLMEVPEANAFALPEEEFSFRRV